MVQERPGWMSPFAALSRRSMLAGGGVLAAGASVAAVGAAAFGSALPAEGSTRAGQLGEAGFNVHDFGAVGDGRTDDTASIQRAISAAATGGGMVFLPAGTYLTGRLTLHSRVHLRGSGGDATVLKLRPGANSAIIESEGFAELTGTRANRGITMFSVRDLTLDGNKQHNTTGGYGLRLYGYGYELSEVIAFNCRDDGVFSEWGPLAALASPSHQMESRLTAVRSHDNEGHGINFNGPHDSMFLNCLTFENRVTGFRLAGDSSGTSMVNCHAWGIRQNISFDLAAPSIGCMNCYADLNGGVGVRISRSDCRWVGGLVLGYNHPQPNQEIGIQLAPGTPATEPSGTVIDTKILNCGTAAVDFGADRGLSSVRVVAYQPGVPDDKGNPVPGTGLGWIGTPADTTQVEIVGGVGDTRKNLVIRPAFDLRAQPTPQPPGTDTVRIFTREVGGRLQLCAMFPGGSVHVLAADT